MLPACRIYQEHPLSRFHKVKHNTRKTYIKDLKLLERTVGKRLIRNVALLDVQHWYDEWRKPETENDPERIDRAHDGVAMFGTVIYFNAPLRNQDCKVLASDLEHVKFEKGVGRSQAWRPTCPSQTRKRTRPSSGAVEQLDRVKLSLL